MLLLLHIGLHIHKLAYVAVIEAPRFKIERGWRCIYCFDQWEIAHRSNFSFGHDDSCVSVLGAASASASAPTQQNLLKV